MLPGLTTRNDSRIKKELMPSQVLKGHRILHSQCSILTARLGTNRQESMTTIRTTEPSVKSPKESIQAMISELRKLPEPLCHTNAVYPFFSIPKWLHMSALYADLFFFRSAQKHASC